MDIDFSVHKEVDTLEFSSGGNKVRARVLRLDKIHPHVSGNKWFKLKYNLLQAKKEKKPVILSFGGNYSNHLHALAYAGKIFDFETIGMVRGDEVQNPTMEDCLNWGMHLHFISRDAYRRKDEVIFLRDLQSRFPDAYFIPEGGDNDLGRKGCSEILTDIPVYESDILCVPVGTASTLTGILNSTQNMVWGFPVTKNNRSLESHIERYARHHNWRLIQDYSFGGFGRFDKPLLSFMKAFRQRYGIETDLVYVGKMFYGLLDMLEKGSFAEDKTLLIIHTGGLQGNRSQSGIF